MAAVSRRYHAPRRGVSPRPGRSQHGSHRCSSLLNVSLNTSARTAAAARFVSKVSSRHRRHRRPRFTEPSRLVAPASASCLQLAVEGSRPSRGLCKAGRSSRGRGSRSHLGSARAPCFPLLLPFFINRRQSLPPDPYIYRPPDGQILMGCIFPSNLF